MATLIDYILIPLDLKTIVHAHALCIDMIPSDPEVSKCNQSRWPSNCTGFHGHHIMRNSSIAYVARKQDVADPMANIIVPGLPESKDDDTNLNRLSNICLQIP